MTTEELKQQKLAQADKTSFEALAKWHEGKEFGTRPRPMRAFHSNSLQQDRRPTSPVCNSASPWAVLPYPPVDCFATLLPLKGER
jgi:hypothetical protein